MSSKKARSAEFAEIANSSARLWPESPLELQQGLQDTRKKRTNDSSDFTALGRFGLQREHQNAKQLGASTPLTPGTAGSASFVDNQKSIWSFGNELTSPLYSPFDMMKKSSSGDGNKYAGNQDTYFNDFERFPNEHSGSSDFVEREYPDMVSSLYLDDAFEPSRASLYDSMTPPSQEKRYDINVDSIGVGQSNQWFPQYQAQKKSLGTLEPTNAQSQKQDPGIISPPTVKNIGADLGPISVSCWLENRTNTKPSTLSVAFLNTSSTGSYVDQFLISQLGLEGKIRKNGRKMRPKITLRTFIPTKDGQSAIQLYIEYTVVVLEYSHKSFASVEIGLGTMLQYGCDLLLSEGTVRIAGNDVGITSTRRNRRMLSSISSQSQIRNLWEDEDAPQGKHQIQIQQQAVQPQNSRSTRQQNSAQPSQNRKVRDRNDKDKDKEKVDKKSQNGQSNENTVQVLSIEQAIKALGSSSLKDSSEMKGEEVNPRSLYQERTTSEEQKEIVIPPVVKPLVSPEIYKNVVDTANEVKEVSIYNSKSSNISSSWNEGVKANTKELLSTTKPEIEILNRDTTTIQPKFDTVNFDTDKMPELPNLPDIGISSRKSTLMSSDPASIIPSQSTNIKQSTLKPSQPRKPKGIRQGLDSGLSTRSSLNTNTSLATPRPKTRAWQKFEVHSNGSPSIEAALKTKSSTPSSDLTIEAHTAHPSSEPLYREINTAKKIGERTVLTRQDSPLVSVRPSGVQGSAFRWMS